VPNQPVATGTLTFVNNTVDPNTATIQLKATFPNTDNVLWPGQFAESTVTLASETAVVVPSQAIQAGQQGPFVFVVKPDLRVESRKVEPGRRLERNETIVTRGLAPGERIVTDGQLRLVPGAKVEIKTAARPS
jgi:multidrug efflux system membrane fusion protein